MRPQANAAFARFASEGASPAARHAANRDGRDRSQDAGGSASVNSGWSDRKRAIAPSSSSGPKYRLSKRAGPPGRTSTAACSRIPCCLSAHPSTRAGVQACAARLKHPSPEQERRRHCIEETREPVGQARWGLHCDSHICGPPALQISCQLPRALAPPRWQSTQPRPVRRAAIWVDLPPGASPRDRAPFHLVADRGSPLGMRAEGSCR